MPELPEVETVRQQLRRKVLNKTIARVEVFRSKSVEHDADFADTLTGKTIADIDRVGKLMIFSFVTENNLFMLAHLKMTGQFFLVDDKGQVVGGGHSVSASNLNLPTSHTRVAFHFTDNSVLYFNDMRVFGYTKLATAEETDRARARFGPEPINSQFDTDWFYEKLQKRKTPIKAAMLDQTFIAGLGNIYVDEALWRAGILPTRLADKVSKSEAEALAKAAGDVMNESIVVGGTTFQHFKDTGGENGNFTDYLKVFGQQGQVCERCGGTIRKIRCAGRGTHYCPDCQQ